MTRHIAGTLARGYAEGDQLLAEELLADAKERAEHIMLVDLGRNDLGRVCEPGRVEVVDFMTVRRYSHVMHIESTVTGRLAAGRMAFDVLTACFPRHAVRRTEATRHGDHRGARADPARTVRRHRRLPRPRRRPRRGDCDSHRTTAGRVAHVQAGAGIVADSDPAIEDAGIPQQGLAVLGAVAIAESVRPPVALVAPSGS